MILLLSRHCFQFAYLSIYLLFFTKPPVLTIVPGTICHFPNIATTQIAVTADCNDAQTPENTHQTKCAVVLKNEMYFCYFP